MKTHHFSLFVALFMLVISACKKEKNPEPLDVSKITLTTTEPTINNSGSISIITGGNASIKLKDYDNLTFGVCYGLSNNPTLLDQTVYTYSAEDGQFVVEINSIESGKKYYFRAFVKDESNNTVKYGNQVQKDLVLDFNINDIRDIRADRVTVDVYVSPELSNANEVGFCVSTTPNPTVSNNYISSPTGGSGLFTLTSNDTYYPTVDPATTYYIRAYIYINSRYYYSEQKTFKTPGYTGGSGGIVFYDKGSVSDGWRYLEVAPVNLEYNSDQSFVWSCNNTSIATSSAIGAGLNNSNLIRSECNYDNVAATLCRYLSYNGKNDWFLPSLEEIKALYRLRKVGILNVNDDFWSSTQVSPSIAYAIDFGDGSIYQSDKYNYKEAWRVRRF
jgi:hypothetical protein